MLMFIVCRVVSAWFAFLLPCYSTFKALSHRPLSEPDLERWAMYWCVVGGFVALEYTTEWLVSWFPFYWEMKVLFLLFLSLPPIQGSTFIYTNYVQPFFASKEADIDAGLAAAKTNVLIFLQTRLSALWDILWSLLNKTPAARQQLETGQPAQAPASAVDPLESAKALWSAYGPAVMGTFQRFSGRSAAAGADASGLTQRSTTPSAAPRPPSIFETKSTTPYGNGNGNGSAPSVVYRDEPPSSHSSNAPPFPEPFR